MTDALNEIFDFLGGKIGGLAETVLNGTIIKFCVQFLEFLGKLILQTGCSLYNTLIKLSGSFLTQSPKDWMGGSGWAEIQKINDGFIVVGLTLITVFWLVAFFSEVTDFRSEIRLEKMLINLTRLSVAQWLVCHSLDIVGALFSLVGDLIPGGTSSIEIDVNYVVNTMEAYAEDNYTLSSLALMAGIILMGAIFALVMVVIGVLILKTSFVRFFKVLIIVPYGALASSTVAGTHAVSSSAVSFYKYALNCILEAVTMIIAIKVYAAIVGSMSKFMMDGNLGKSVTVSSASFIDIGISLGGSLLIQIILALAMYSVIKEASTMTQRALGL